MVIISGVPIFRIFTVDRDEWSQCMIKFLPRTPYEGLSVDNPVIFFLILYMYIYIEDIYFLRLIPKYISSNGLKISVIISGVRVCHK